MKRYIRSSIVSRKSQYDEYLKNHIDGVVRAYNELVRPNLVSARYLDSSIIAQIDDQIRLHDKSKYFDTEYNAYLDYFYPDKNSSKSKKAVDLAFDIAWYNHQKRNPHHWQYWLLIRDEGEIVPLDMDVIFIVEMICDWSSFHYTDLSSTAHKWYHDNKSKMILSDNTRRIIDEIFELCPEV